VNWLEASAAVLSVIYVALDIQDDAVAVGNLLTQTDTTTPITVSGLGFEPKAVLLLSHCHAESTQDTLQDDDQWSIGAFTAADARQAMGIADDDAAATTSVSTAVEYDAAYANLNPGADAVQGLMDVQSVDSDGFTLIMDDADPSQNFVAYLALGEPTAGAAGGGGLIRHAGRWR
jgi:hypothetical protein